jgi:hypothetical protein
MVREAVSACRSATASASLRRRNQVVESRRRVDRRRSSGEDGLQASVYGR